jgi:hypothetical protein
MILKSAKADAMLFVGEFGEALDPATTDWDERAFFEASCELRLPRDEHEEAWPIYQKALVEETKRLMEKQ